MHKGRYRFLAAALQQSSGPAKQLQESAGSPVRHREHEPRSCTLWLSWSSLWNSAVASSMRVGSGRGAVGGACLRSASEYGAAEAPAVGGGERCSRRAARPL